MGGHVTVELACAVQWNVPGSEARLRPMITSWRSCAASTFLGGYQDPDSLESISSLRLLHSCFSSLNLLSVATKVLLICNSAEYASLCCCTTSFPTTTRLFHFDCKQPPYPSFQNRTHLDTDCFPSRSPLAQCISSRFLCVSLG